MGGERLRFAIVGCGQIARKGHIPNLLRIDGAAITALCDPAPEMVAAARTLAPSAATYSDFSEMLGSAKLDAVIVATPNWLHGEQVLAALDAGKHVFCEKPMGISVEEAERIQAAAGQSRGILQIGHELRHAKPFEVAKARVDQGVIGRIQMMRYNEFRKPLLPGWRQTGKTGGVMLEKNSHFFDLFNWYADAPAVRVIGSGANNVNTDSPLIDNCFVIVEYANGVRALLSMCLFGEHGGTNGLELVGERGMIVVRDERVEVFQRDRGLIETVDARVEPPEGMHMGCRRELEHFIECARLGRTPRNNAATALDTLRVCVWAEGAVGV